MAEPETGVGVNGEPDDFAARYDRMVDGGGGRWVVGTIVVLVVGLVVVGVVRSWTGI